MRTAAAIVNKLTHGKVWSVELCVNTPYSHIYCLIVCVSFSEMEGATRACDLRVACLKTVE